MSKDKYVAYVGTYTHENSIGIHLYDLDEGNGTMVERKVIPINNASYLVVANSGKYRLRSRRLIHPPDSDA